MIRKAFALVEHFEFGSIGLQPLDMPHADPLGGMAVAHDILEHFPGDDGGVEAELQALGASLWVRNLDEYYHQKGQFRTDPAENIAADFPELWSHVWEGFELRLTGKGRSRLDDSEADEIILRACDLGVKYIRDNGGGGLPNLDYQIAMKRWMRVGYRRARARFRGIDRSELVWLFMEIERRAQRVIEQCGDVFHEGQTIHFAVDAKRGNVIMYAEGFGPEDEYC